MSEIKLLNTKLTLVKQTKEISDKHLQSQIAHEQKRKEEGMRKSLEAALNQEDEDLGVEDLQLLSYAKALENGPLPVGCPQHVQLLSSYKGIALF